MPSPSDQGGRPVTPCPKCQTADVKAVALASNFVYLRCRACAFLFVIEDRRSGVRPEASGPDLFLVAEASPGTFGAWNSIHHLLLHEHAATINTFSCLNVAFVCRWPFVLITAHGAPVPGRTPSPCSDTVCQSPCRTSPSEQGPDNEADTRLS